MVSELNAFITKFKFVAAIALASVIGGLTVTLVQAAIPSSEGKINACYLNNASLFNGKGTLRVIDTDTTQCAGSETAVSWDQEGSSAVGYVTIHEGQEPSFNVVTEHTKGLLEQKVVLCQDLIDPSVAPDCSTDEIVASCYDLAFTPRFVTGYDVLPEAPTQEQINIYMASDSIGLDKIENEYCGSGYDVLEPSPSGRSFAFFK